MDRWDPFYVGEVPERGMVANTSDPLSSVPQVAQATAAAGSRSSRLQRGEAAGPYQGGYPTKSGVTPISWTDEVA